MNIFLNMKSQILLTNFCSFFLKGLFIGVNIFILKTFWGYYKSVFLSQEPTIDDIIIKETTTNDVKNIIEKPMYKDKYLDILNKMHKSPLTDEKINSLNTSIIIENTPKGNVLMFWDNKRETFTYYADNSIPYYILEVVSRKYVIVNDCSVLYINMKDELDIAERKFKNAPKSTTTSDNNIVDENNSAANNSSVDNNKIPSSSVFAKFKNYNKDNNKSSSIVLDSTKKVENSNNSKNSRGVNISNKEDIFIKEKANRYSYEGKLNNYSFLKKVDKKLINKKYKVSFTEFKLSCSSCSI